VSRTRIVLFTLLALAVTAPILPAWARFLLTVVLAKGLVVAGLMLMYRAGLMSFGQGLYYCLGAYTAGTLAQFLHVTDGLLLATAAMVVSAGIGALLGLLMAKYRGIFFGLLSMAFSMILYGLLVKSSPLGSTDGFTLPVPTLLGLGLPTAVGQYIPYGIGLVAAGIAVIALGRYLESPLGRLGPAIRDNEIRVEYLGASVREAIHIEYVVAAALAGAGGGITAMTVGHIDPEMAYWTTSGEFVFVTVLSGAGSVVAPFVGALVFEAIRSFAYQYSPNTWQMVVGGSMLLVIVFLPAGLWSLFRRKRAAGG
jgi:ABC-type branched-subunit amino acid transport system permease subunit